MTRPLLASLFAALLLACGAGFPREEVTQDPIAFMQHDNSEGIASIDQFRDAMRVPNPNDPRSLRPRRVTKLALLEVPSGRITQVPGVIAGSMPLDWSSDGFKLLIGRFDDATGRLYLSTWNRATGAHEVVTPNLTSGTASLGVGPIRVARVGRVSRGVGTPVPGIEVQIEHRGLFALKGGAPGRSPDIASDGRSVLFERPAGGAQRDGIVLLGGFDSEEPRALGRGSAPRFSRDGKWITFLRRRDGQTDVWLMRADGSGKRQLTNSSFDEEYPSVSPDGAHVVFASVRPPSSQSQIYLLRVQDGKQMQLTQAGQNSRPLW